MVFLHSHGAIESGEGEVQGLYGQMWQKFTDDRNIWTFYSSEWFEVSPRTDITHETDANQKEKHFIALLHF